MKNLISTLLLSFFLPWSCLADLATNLVNTTPGSADTLPKAMSLINTNLKGLDLRVTTLEGQTNGYQSLDADLTDLADGTLSGSKVGAGISAANLDIVDETGLRSSSSNQIWFINVADYIPVNASDANVAIGIQKAIDQTTNSFFANANAAWFTNSHAKVFFPVGTYNIDRPLFVRVGGCEFIAEGGWTRTRIVQNANTNVWMAMPWGWNDGGANTIYMTKFRGFNISQGGSFGTARRGHGFSLVSPTQSTYLWRRVVIEDCNINGFYVGIRGDHGVGLTVRNCDIRANCFANYLTKFDNCVYQRVSAGEGYGGAAWGTNTSIAWWFESGLAEAFNLSITGCEAGGDKHIIKGTGGDIGVFGFNAELDNIGDDTAKAYGPAFDFSSGVNSVALMNLRVGSLNNYGNNTNPVFNFSGGSGKKSLIHGSGITSSAYPAIRLDTAGDYIRVVGTSQRVTNTAEGVLWYAPFDTNRVVLAAGTGIALAQSQAGPVTTVTVSTNPPTGITTNTAWVYRNNVLPYRNSVPITTDMFDEPWYTQDTTHGTLGHQYFPRWAVHCSDLTGSFYVYHQPSQNLTYGKTNLVMTQYFTTTNISRNNILAMVAYRSMDNVVRANQGTLTSSYDQLQSGTKMFSVTNLISLPPLCTNGFWEITAGRGVNFSPTNTIWWLGAKLEFY